ncbi:MAG: adenylosuccinate lyase [Actinomycetota bacterium]|nr:adenylosuccinate lyase [Actinomycetota bacterium]
MQYVIERYTLPEMGQIWSDQRRLETWMEVEVLALEAWAKLGKVPDDVVAAVRSVKCPTPDDVATREEITNHDLAAFVDLLGEAAGGEAAGYVHYGLTSSDVLDTALGSLLMQSADLLLDSLASLFEVVKRKAEEHEATYMIGRTHGIWAEPTTFGLKLAGWAFELSRDHTRLEAARSSVAVGKISGAVGTYSHVPSEIESHVCPSLGLAIEPASTQVTARDRHAEYLQVLALIGASVERMATEIRHLQRSEVSEVREAFGKGQKGSSAMPHKRNPILSERMTGMARLLRGYAQVGLENVALWHERDISHSSAERVVLPDASIVLHYMLVKFANLIENLVVDVDRMKANLASTQGLVFSQAILLALVDSGLTRDTAYRIVQAHAMTAWNGDRQLRDLLAADPDVGLTGEELDGYFALEAVSESAAVIFQRLESLQVGLRNQSSG